LAFEFIILEIKMNIIYFIKYIMSKRRSGLSLHKKIYKCCNTPDLPTTTFTVTYNGNTSTGGSVPSDSSSPYNDGSSVTVLGNVGTLVKTGYDFAGWNTAANGTGTSYAPTDTFSIGSDTILYAQWTPVVPTTYTVAYNGNTSTGGSVPSDSSSPYNDGSSVTVLGNVGTLVKTGYDFAGWNTAANGTGTSYAPTDTFSIGSDTILYAQWTPVVPTTYTVTYDGNANTSGNSPADTSSPYSSGSTVNILGNAGSPVLAKTGYQFSGWNTAADGSGTNYVGGNTFTINSDTILYANWTIGGYILRYLAGTGGTGTAPPSSDVFYPAFSAQPIVDNVGPFTNGSLVFGGWNTSTLGTGISYPAGSTVTMTANITLYAQWINPAISYTLTYDENSAAGGSGTAPNSPNPTTYSSNSTATILGNTGSYTNSDPNKIFYGWNTLANGTGTSYLENSTITMTANTTLYAQWVSATPQYTVTYDSNGSTGGSVPASPTNYPSGVKVPILGQGTLTKPGYTFVGWNSSSKGIGSLYAPGYTFASKTATLYAQWVQGTTIKACGGSSSSGSGLTAMSYIFPYAQIIKSADTVTIYTTSLMGTDSTNYGSGAAPLGIISVLSKTVITSTIITINVNTSYLNSENDYNYAHTITNGVDVTYWPVAATISSVTFPTQNLSNSNPPNYSISTQYVTNGCGLTASGYSSGATQIKYNFFNQGIIINYSDSTSTTILSSPTNALYTANSGTSWTTIPRTFYPYSLIVPTSDNALTTLSVTPSTSSQYIYPPLPNYTIEYNGNGNTSGSPPIPQYMDPYLAGTTTVAIRTNTGALAKTSFTFSGWNTAADGTGTNYAINETYNGGESLKLYAKWV
jgi:uncharacterized repeat protein (TIGR02543 family)